ncbi:MULTISPECIES: DUF6338 family protein [Methylobacter]
MENLTADLAADLVSLLRYLLPGFLATWIFYGFTSYTKPSQFERVVQALIFTLIVKSVVYCVRSILLWTGNFYVAGEWNEQSVLITSIFSATIVGFVFAFFANTDKFHYLARTLGITRETSYPSEWYGVFSKNITYVVLHLNDERRIYGWPTDWPSESGKGHFSLEQASWLVDGKEIPITGVKFMLIRAEDVKWVEFMNKN